MAIKKEIAIVGATEETGTILAGALGHLDIDLILVDKDNEQLLRVKKGLLEKAPNAEINVAECIKDGCWEADIIILAVPRQEEAEVADIIREVATQKTVIALRNEEEPEALRELLPYSKLIFDGHLSMANYQLLINR